VPEDSGGAEQLGRVLDLGVRLQLVEVLVVCVVEVRVHQRVGLHLLVVEHLIGCAEVTLFEVVLVGAVAEEEMAGGAVFDID